MQENFQSESIRSTCVNLQEATFHVSHLQPIIATETLNFRNVFYFVSYCFPAGSNSSSF